MGPAKGLAMDPMMDLLMDRRIVWLMVLLMDSMMDPLMDLRMVWLMDQRMALGSMPLSDYEIEASLGTRMV
jgi:hypothetical protein